jgi:hypothetical protein
MNQLSMAPEQIRPGVWIQGFGDVDDSFASPTLDVGHGKLIRHTRGKTKSILQRGFLIRI